MAGLGQRVRSHCFHISPLSPDADRVPLLKRTATHDPATRPSPTRTAALCAAVAATLLLLTHASHATDRPTRAFPVVGADFVAQAQDDLSLGLTHDPYAKIALPRCDLMGGAERPDTTARWGPPIAQRLPRGVRMSAPLDLALQYRVPLEFCPDYWPEHEPGKTLAEFCEDEYLGYWPLEQDLADNPFAIAKQQVEALNEDRAAVQRRVTAALAHWWLNGHTTEAVGSTVLGALASEKQLHNDIVVEMTKDLLLEIGPESLWQVVADETSLAVDLRISSSLSHDTAVSMSRMLQLAAQRGINAVVVADPGHIGGAQEAARIAEKLKCQGLLPESFQVVTGEHVNCLGGTLTAVGIKYRVLEGMTFERTIDEIHAQGGVALLNHPGKLGGMDLLRRLDVDGYFIQPSLFELFRTLNILYDPQLADKPALYGSHTRHAQGVGLPYSAVITQSAEPEAIVAALRRGDAYAASNLYFPLMGLLVLKPIASFEKTLNGYFIAHDWLTTHTRTLLNADHVIITTTWDESVQGLMSLDDTFKEMRAISDGESPLLRAPKITSIAAQYGPLQIQYSRHTDEVWLRGRASF